MHCLCPLCFPLIHYLKKGLQSLVGIKTGGPDSKFFLDYLLWLRKPSFPSWDSWVLRQPDPCPAGIRLSQTRACNLSPNSHSLWYFCGKSVASVKDCMQAFALLILPPVSVCSFLLEEVVGWWRRGLLSLTFLLWRWLRQALSAVTCASVSITHHQAGDSDTFHIITLNDCNARWDQTCVISKARSTMAGFTEEWPSCRARRTEKSGGLGARNGGPEPIVTFVGNSWAGN